MALLFVPFSAALAGKAAARTLEAYPGEQSVTQGDTLDLHVRCAAPTYTVSIWRQGQALEYVADLGSHAGQGFSVPVGAWELGCGWPVTNRIPVSASWDPGAYLANLTAGAETAWIPFVVRAGIPGSYGRILLQMSTAQAYNRYGGKSLYTSLLPANPGRAMRVSFHRPYEYFATDGSGSFFLWDAPFISFLESEGYAFEVCTSVDLHAIRHFWATTRPS